MTRLPYHRYLELIRADAERLAGAARHLDAPVPPCPGWDVREAVRHTGSVYRNKAACLRLGRAPEEHEWIRAPEPHEDVVLWVSDSLELLLDQLSARDAADPAYTWWAPEQTAGFWARRMALETAVHRADVESASGAVTPVDGPLAVDGVDEVLQIFLTGRGDAEAHVERPGTVAVAADGEAWTVHLAPGAITVDTGKDGTAGATLGGDPSRLFLYLWGRGPLEPLERSGDRALVEELRTQLARSTQ